MVPTVPVLVPVPQHCCVAYTRERKGAVTVPNSAWIRRAVIWPGRNAGQSGQWISGWKAGPAAARRKLVAVRPPCRSSSRPCSSWSAAPRFQQLIYTACETLVTNVIWQKSKIFSNRLFSVAYFAQIVDFLIPITVGPEPEIIFFP